MKELEGLVAELQHGRLSRRQFMERALALGLSASVIGTVLAACGSSSSSSSASSSASPAAMDTTMPDKIYFFNWADYLDPSLKKKFKQETGITVVESYFDSNDDLFGKLKAGQGGYDLICPGGYLVSIFRKSDLLQPLDMKYIPSFSEILAPIQKPVFDDPAQQNGLKYSVPYMYGTAGIGVRTDLYPQEVTGWDTMWDPANKGKITMLNAERTAIGQTLKYLGYSLNTTDTKQVDEATQKLIEQKPLVLKYEASGLPREMASGTPLVNCYDGDAAIAKRDIGAKKLNYVLPSTGAYFWVDNLAVTKSAASPYGAHLFIEFLTKAENSAQNSTWIGYQTPNEKAFAMIKDPIVRSLRPTDEQWASGEIANDLGEFETYYVQAWAKVKSA
jgi:spermidine/putrescine transport system substrate-binding protein